jgi:hypothetical protein
MTENRDPFALGGRPDAELVALEDELKATMAMYDKDPLTDDEANSISHKCRDLEQRINETPPKTAIGVAVKLRQVLRIIDDGSDLEDDETTSLQQLLAFAEASS